MDIQKLISIIIPVFNRESIISETLDSILDQTYPYWECIIVDDGSTDSTISVIRQYEQKDNRFKLFLRNQSPKGAPTCRNIGIANIRGTYFMFLDSDDLLANFCIERRVRTAEQKPDHDAWVFPSRFFKDGQLLDKLFFLQDSKLYPDLAFFIRPQWAMNGSFFLHEKFKLHKISFDVELPFWQDWAFHLDCLLDGLKFYIPKDAESDVYIRQHNAINRINNNKHFDRSSIEAIFQKILSMLKIIQQKYENSYPYVEYRLHYLLENLLYKGYKNQLNFGFQYITNPLNSKYYTIMDNIIMYLIKLPLPSIFLAYIYNLVNKYMKLKLLKLINNSNLK